ncbi:MAG: protein-export membrane protein SecD [Candidatus Taylorbacteria bacterium RIFCSPLOWO2_12_FULL_44_15c]|uniref:Protein translocase subunit SecD n=1 Tax=Candidatus Taylorbacteria bacterium RIFCSPLOWO2_12_FULL_44_15c TaxID=1802333 RepID=A0A1G2P690_9BACT|nr:MAG: protein-export membrane protein SecD [Candidatus Taylorbacteria bacterium RIFCSPLOWO2_12_FULL_44_15c]
MFRQRIIALLVIVAAIAVGYFVYQTESSNSNYNFKLGLDLNGGSHLVYQADVSEVTAGDIASSMEALRNVIERRFNLFGVSEPIVQTESAGLIAGKTIAQKLIVELPGVADIDKAIEMIGKTPLLEFKLVQEGPPAAGTTTPTLTLIPTGLTGRLLKRAALEFGQNIGEPQVLLNFTDEGKNLFAKITKENIGKVLGIFLDGQPLSLPIVREEIRDGNAVISGDFTPTEAKTLVRDLNYGALPVPIKLLSTQKIGASLGADAVKAGVKAGKISFLVIALFLILWYRLPGVVAIVALTIYIILNLAIFKLIPVTLTAAGIAGFILSIGMAVDANILIFERLKEELRRGRTLQDAIHEGFARAWTSIRDSNLSSLITAVILFWLASTSVIKGFALVFGIGVLTSMLTAITVSRTLLLALGVKKENKITRFLFSCGIK